MDANFQRALSRVLKHEGGYVDHPKDPGGATNRGITLATFRRYVKPKATKADLRAITDAQITTVYRRHYWDAVLGAELPSGVDYAVFDFAVNSGPSRSVKFLQRVVGVTQDGRIGPITLAALAKDDPQDVVSKLCDARLAWLKRLETWPTFGRGWERRVSEVKRDAFLDAADTAIARATVNGIEDVGAAVEAIKADEDFKRKRIADGAVAGGLAASVIAAGAVIWKWLIGG
ncbi:MAG: glycoside hydrolase family 108 protein [Oricola sp.]|nr:glycoside hydrolase family 108 protein [Oricola sp.]MCI5078689.1 glycoside hydrolase family 108 protein [Oricola sp.]